MGFTVQKYIKIYLHIGLLALCQVLKKDFSIDFPFHTPEPLTLKKFSIKLLRIFLTVSAASLPPIAIKNFACEDKFEY